jgi:hypothetical protein
MHSSTHAVATTQTAETGMIYTIPTNLNSQKTLQIRIMNGQPNGGQYKGPRVITTTGNNSDYVQPSGAPFPNGTPKADRKAGGILI